MFLYVILITIAIVSGLLLFINTYTSLNRKTKNILNGLVAVTMGILLLLGTGILSPYPGIYIYNLHLWW